MFWLLAIGTAILLWGRSLAFASSSSNFDALARHIAAQNSLDPRLVLAIIERESSGNPQAKNPNDPSYGLMGIEPFWVAFLYPGTGGDPVEWLYMPENNIRCGCGVIRYFMSKGYQFPSQVDIYNVGETKWTQGIRNSDYRTFILSAMARY